MGKPSLKSVVYGNKILAHTMKKENNIHSIVQGQTTNVQTPLRK